MYNSHVLGIDSSVTNSNAVLLSLLQTRDQTRMTMIMAMKMMMTIVMIMMMMMMIMMMMIMMIGGRTKRGTWS